MELKFYGMANLQVPYVIETNGEDFVLTSEDMQINLNLCIFMFVSKK